MDLNRDDGQDAAQTKVNGYQLTASLKIVTGALS